MKTALQILGWWLLAGLVLGPLVGYWLRRCGRHWEETQ